MTKFEDTGIRDLEDLATYLEEIDRGLDQLGEELVRVKEILLDLALSTESSVIIRAEMALAKVETMQKILENSK